MSVQTNECTENQEIRVVIVEDYKLTRVGLRCALNQIENINVVAEAESAEEGIEIIKREQPDVVLMDLGLPNMNGLEATIKIKEMFSQIKVVILTSHDREEEVLASFGSGANAYCLKDIEPKALSDVIKSAAKGACWIDPTVARLALKLFPKPENVEFLSKNTNTDPKGHLTEREQEVLKLLVQGRSNTEIAKELIVSVHTAKAHVCSILQKLCVDDRVQAAVKAIKEGLVKA
ncbi:TPA: response regulator transcription factor [Candidatus Galligastranaerophilus intestinavium]|uniref:Response regulator transcription factor n=1 Tax=Candidatus Galligastranaerophilus intestinavium TaxID=2840836 RepID=A0A9D1FHW3_9BACT|nr:response regulator transcription factor [Candidatus Galligastranaerophilus intestinavium]